MTINRRFFLSAIGTAFLASSMPAWGKEIQTMGGPAFGSWWRASFPNSADTLRAKQLIEKVIFSVDTTMSPYKPYSEISIFNQTMNTDWQQVSQETIIVIRESLAVAAKTGGAFDPTVGPMVARYGFGPIKGNSVAGFGAIQLGARGVRKRVPYATLDLCGIAKGYALDRMAGRLVEHGFDAFLLEAGGEVIARGHHPSGRRWQVGIENPDSATVALHRIVGLDNQALATSGNAANGGQIEGISYSHIINPATRRPISNALSSVSVISDTAMRSDALASALMVMGPELGLAFARRENIAALFQIGSGATKTEKMSEHFSRYIVA